MSAYAVVRGQREPPRGMLVLVAFVLVASGCASGAQPTSGTQTTPGRRSNGPPAAGGHGSRVPWSEELAERLPLHVKARVLSSETMRYVDDPFWPLKDDPEYEQDGDNWVAVWNLEVVEWIKGVSMDEIRVTQALESRNGEPVIGAYDFVQPREAYIFYLELNGLAEFGPGAVEKTEEANSNLAAHPPRRHWYLGHAEPPEEPTFPGAGATEE